MVKINSEDGNYRMVPRYSFEALLKGDPGDCQRIHEFEVERLKEFENKADIEVTEAIEVFAEGCEL